MFNDEVIESSLKKSQKLISDAIQSKESEETNIKWRWSCFNLK